MAFDLNRWREEVRAWWAEHGSRLRAAPVESAYGALAASAWLPFVAALAQDPGSATAALVSVTAGIGTNLVANVVQGIYDRARGDQQVTAQAQEDAATRAELEAVLNSTRALEAAQEALGERWDDFARQLRQEMQRMPGRSDLIVTLSGEFHSAVAVGGDAVDLRGSRGAVFKPSGPVEQHWGDRYYIAQDIRAEEEARQQELALRAYLERLTGECNVLHLRGMDPRAADATKETMSLAAVYTALDTSRGVPLGDEELAALKKDRRKLMPEGLDEAVRERQAERSLSAIEAASRFDRLVLLGDPGGGKSTFVNYLAFRLAQASLDGDGLAGLPGWTRGALVPISVVLRDLARSPRLAERGSAAALWGFVEDSLTERDLGAAAPALKARLDGRAALLLDGLDEVDPEARQRVLEAVADFAHTHRRTPILVTCRVYAYQDPQWKLAGFEEATLQPFDEEKIDHFVAAWYAEVARMGLMSPGEAGERSARLREAVRRRDLRALAPNPLLLTMMALLHSSWGRLPEDRVQLYSEIVELLLARWEQSRLGREALTRARLAPRDLRFALEEVAFTAHGQQPSGEGTADVSEALLRQVLQGYLEGDWNRAGEVIRYVRERAGLLLERKPGVYAFPHRTLQEYLAGCHLSVQEAFPELAADLLRRDETRWREPFLLAIGKTGRAENRIGQALAVVDELCARECAQAPTDEAAYRCAWLAGEALLEIGVEALQRRETGATRLERVAGWLARLLEAGALTPVERAAAGRVLGLLGDPRDLEALVFVPGGPFMMGSGEEDKEAYDDEKPQHIVEVGDFCIGKYPVTNGQYRRFVEAGGYDERRYWTEAGWAWREGRYDSKASGYLRGWLKRRPAEKRDRPFFWDDPAWNLPNLPVVGVSWFEALAYCRWLTEQFQVSGYRLQVWRDGHLETLKPETLQPETIRLPSEAEWEKAARGADGRIYPWGNEEITPQRANYGETGIGQTSAVGAFPAGASPYGCLDMIGNVWEWCSSVGYGEAPYPYRADDGREELERDVVRALRGGSWDNTRRYSRCAVRVRYAPGTFDDDIGFRVVFPGPFSAF